MACAQAGELRDVLLVRHAQVCRALTGSSFFPANQSVDITEKFCWVIDSWPSGETLTTLMATLSISPTVIPAIMLSLATALSELHAEDIVLRDLHPDTIYYDLETGRLSVVDFELAKLLDGSPTVVHGELQLNPFRAPECVGHKIDHTADIFSWGQLLGWLVTGKTPGEVLPSDIRLPPKLLALWRACLADSFRERPPSFAKLIPAVKRWKP
jgi:serine/threonine protein kinase